MRPDGVVIDASIFQDAAGFDKRVEHLDHADLATEAAAEGFDERFCHGKPASMYRALAWMSRPGLRPPQRVRVLAEQADGVYDGHAHQVPARALQRRGPLPLKGRCAT